MSQLDTHTTPAQMLARAHSLVTQYGRVIIGLTGPPGAGKSTLATQLVSSAIAVGIDSVIVPMDGFHISHAQFTQLDQTHVKGAPHTFDADGYIELMRRVRMQGPGAGPVWAPEFVRPMEDPIGARIAVRPEHRLIVTEGNYLLMRSWPWLKVRALLDEAWFVDSPDLVRQERLISRHVQFGRSHPDAIEHALGSDQRNAELVASTRERADWIVTV